MAEEKHLSSQPASSIAMLLLQRHRALLTRQVVINITGRVLSFGLLVLVAFSNRVLLSSYSVPSSITSSATSPELWPTRASRLSEFLLFTLAATVIGFFWEYFARTNDEQLSRLEEIIVQGNDIGRDTITSKQPAMADAANDPQQSSLSERDNYSLAETKEADRWKQIYIEWKHESWRYPNRERLMRLEPLAWFLLVLAFVAVKLLFGLNIR
jgi:hypothetical protein